MGRHIFRGFMARRFISSGGFYCGTPGRQREASLRARRVREQTGFSLMSVLFLTAVVSTVFMAMAVYSRDSDEIERARASGWHLVQTAKAARLFVRNNSVILNASLVGPARDVNGDGLDDSTYADPALFGNGAGGIFPQEVTFAQLIDAGLLPQGFKSTNSLKQQIRIFIANYPLNGDPADPATIPSAYVFLVDSRESTPQLMHHVSEAARSSGMPVSAPTFDETVLPINDCNADGQRDVVLWDSGCISVTETDLLVAAAGLPYPFPYAGSLIVPAWRAMPHDTRAVMRFRQAENPSSATMMTNVSLGHEMVDASGNCLNQAVTLMPDGTGGYNTVNLGYCESLMDNPGGATQREQDLRVDIVGTPALEVNRLVLDDQVNVPGGVEVSYTLDASGNPVRNPDGDTVANGLLNPRLPAYAAATDVLDIQGGLSVQKTLHAGINGAIGGPGAYFATADGSAPGLVTVESNLVVSDGDPATFGQTLTVGNALNFGAATVNRANANRFSVGGSIQMNNVQISSASASVNSVSAQNAVVANNFSANSFSVGTLSYTSLNAASLVADRVTGGAVSTGTAGIQMLTTGALSLGNTTLFANGPDLTVTIGCPNPLPIPAPPGCS